MKAFWIKVIDLAVILLVLFMYQSSARSRAAMKASIDELREQLVQKEQAEEADEDDQPLYADGTYEGTGTGYAGDIKVQVVVEGGMITSVEITESDDDPEYFDMASGLTDEIIDGQTTDGVDTVSGATFSSRGILDAVDDALKGAEK